MNDACMTTPEALLARDGERLVFDAPVSQVDRPTHYCPGCHHGIAHRLVAEVLDELDVADRTILVASVGCSAFSYDYFDVDAVEAPHGRACAVATGVLRANPGSVIFTYQGDGDMAAIGLAESVHAANRGELITAVFINNTVYGMTGGQMAPTTLLGQKTTTTPEGRHLLGEGGPCAWRNLWPDLTAWPMPNAAPSTASSTSAPPKRRCATPLKRSCGVLVSVSWSCSAAAPPTGI